MKRSLLLFAIVLLAGCSEKENKVNNRAPIAEIRITADAATFTLDGTLSRDPDSTKLTYKWSSSSPLLTITSPTSAKASCVIPALAESHQADITLEVSDGNLTTSSSQTVLIPSSSLTEVYGLGKNLSTSISNNTNYEWYLDQANSGNYANVNCGPTSVTMAIRWANPGSALSPENARNTYRSGGGWWYTSDIINYLEKYSVSNYTISLTGTDILKAKIDKGGIVILCLDMFYVPSQTVDAYHVSKFYYANSQGWGHFIVIKGYKVVDNQTYFEAYDPYSFGVKYSDNSLKGKDRYYKAADLDNATNNWWDFAIVIPRPGITNGRVATPDDAIDPYSIPHKPGQ